MVKKKEYKGILILPKEAFEIPPIIGHGYSEHHIANFWNDKIETMGKIKSFIKKIVPHSVWRQLGAYKALKESCYFMVYEEAKMRTVRKVKRK